MGSGGSLAFVREIVQGRKALRPYVRVGGREGLESWHSGTFRFAGVNGGGQAAPAQVDADM